MNGSPTDSILHFCPGCGKNIEWEKDIRFCMKCGMNLIPFIPREKIHEWLGVDLTPEEIEELYNQQPVRSLEPQSPSVTPTYSYQQRRPWKWGASIGVPLLATLAKLIVSLVVLVIYIAIVEDLSTIDINNLMDIIYAEHALPIIIIELATQVVFLIVPYLFTSVFFPYKAPKKERWESLGVPFGMKGKQWLIEIGIGVCASILMFGILLGAQWISAYLTQFIFGIPADALLSEDTGDILSQFPSTIPFIIIYCLLMILSIAPSEEVLFRGFAQKGIQDSFKRPKLGKAMALIITAAYFSFFHIYQYIFYEVAALRAPLLFFTFIPYFAVSIILGVLYMWRKNLVSAITAHALYNILLFLIFIVFLT